MIEDAKSLELSCIFIQSNYLKKKKVIKLDGKNLETWQFIDAYNMLNKHFIVGC